MSTPRILVHYSPKLYSELFSSVLKSICGIEIFEPQVESAADGNPKRRRPIVDIIITSLDDNGQPTIDHLPVQARKSKILAFSPTGTIGLRRMPNSNQWEKISPFGLDQLIREVIYQTPNTILLKENQ